LRRGFILRIHGHDRYEGALLAEEQGVLAFSRGDYKGWESIGSLPVLELVYDVYDQKKTPLVFAEAGMPVVPKAIDMTKPPKFKAGDRVRFKDQGEDDALYIVDSTTGAEVVVRDNGYTPEDGDLDDNRFTFDVDDLVLDNSAELGGGNHQANVEPDSVAAAPDTLGLNEAQTDQVPPADADDLSDEQLDQLTAPRASER
jgi:hypothetical protein